uniref:Uncharacterized protein n=1 Tax=Rhizophora mucronata TaxID=61149 RepID=A0A2P2PGJ3_RHIMU
MAQMIYRIPTPKEKSSNLIA